MPDANEVKKTCGIFFEGRAKSFFASVREGGIAGGDIDGYEFTVSLLF